MKKTIADIVVLDSGVDCGHPALKSADISGVTLQNHRIYDEYTDCIGHGTAICGIIHRSIPTSKIYMIKIIDNMNSAIDESDLVFALEYVYDNIDCKVVNLSLGLNLVADHDRLYAICEKLKQKNIAVIAAFDNTGAVSYPAAYDCVYGVDSGKMCERVDDIICCDNSIVNLYAYGKSQRLLWLNHGYLVSGGNSYACAHASSVILKAKMEQMNLTTDDTINKNALYQLHYTDKSLNENRPAVEKYHKAVLYPFNKEIHSLIRFEKELSFSIVDVYDTKYSARVGSFTNAFLEIPDSNNHRIKNIENIEWDTFDVLIVGHTKELNAVAKNHTVPTRDLIAKALKLGKQVFSFDNYADYVCNLNVNQHNFFSPAIDYDANLCILLDKMYKIASPVLGIFGTSSKQGKFTLQLILRYLLQQNGYTVAQLGSEPSSFLFGMDACYHFGYGAQYISDPAYNTWQLNEQLHELDLLKRDIILVGCQSNTIPYDLNNINNLTFPQLSFLFGTQPDCVIICINEFDPIPYIYRTIKSIEMLSDSKVIALVLFPKTISNNTSGIYSKKRKVSFEEFEEKKKALSSVTDIPVYLLGNDVHMKQLVNDIIDFF